MAKKSKSRYGSLQFWPRKRARKFLPRVNWDILKSDKTGLLGFISYKVAMVSCSLSDKTSDSLTKDKKIIIPCTILECPDMRIFSVRFYKYKKVVSDVIVSNDKKLKKLLKLPKEVKKIEDMKEDYDDISVIVYSKSFDTNIKNKVDLTEIGLSGNKEDKLKFIKDNLNKDISIGSFIPGLEENLVDVRGLTRGKGFSGPVKRFGIGLRQHKSEKGVRKVGSIGPWHPARVSFRVPMAGQLGMFTRISYNKKIILSGKISENNINPEEGFKKFGKIKNNYLILKGSIQGPSKRQVLLTKALRPTKKQKKLNYEFLGIEK